MGNKKNIEGWKEVLGNKPESYKKWFLEEKKYFAKYIKPDFKVLEVGCGEGRSLFDILPITKNLVGVDYDKKAVSDSKKAFKNYPSVKILLADGKDLPFERNYFDCVTCIGTFANFGLDKFKILNEMKRVLKDKGFIIISVYSEDALEERMKIYKKLGFNIKKVETDGTVIFGDFGGDNVSEQFSKDQLKAIFWKVGLKVVEIKKAGIGYICKLKKSLRREKMICKDCKCEPCECKCTCGCECVENVQ